MVKKFLLVGMLLLGVLVLVGCGNVQQEYYEVHILEDPADFRFVTPGEGTDTLPENSLENIDTYDLYLYIPIDGEPFNQTQFYSFLGSHFVYRHVVSGKYYILAKDEIETKITQFLLDKEAFEAGEN